MARILREAGADVTFRELPGKGHWWWDSSLPSDGGVLNDLDMRAFYQVGVLVLPCSALFYRVLPCSTMFYPILPGEPPQGSGVAWGMNPKTLN